MATASVDVYVKLPTGRTATLILSPLDRVDTICQRVAQDEGVSPDLVNMKYTGKVLKKCHTIGYLGICPETILKADILKVKKLNLFVKVPSGRTIPIQLNNTSPVRLICDNIASEEDIPVGQQTLKMSGVEIKNKSQRLVDAGISDETVLEIIKTEKPVPMMKKKTKTSSTHSKTVLPDDDSESGKPEDDADQQEDTCDLAEVDKEAVLGSFSSQGRRVEVVFSFDTTGSMYSCLQQVRNRLRDTVRRLLQHIPGIRIGLIAHGDYCDHSNYVLRSTDLTTNVDVLVDFVENVPSTGGGDTPECYEWVLRKSQQLDWSEDSAKALVMIGDCEPHEVSYTDQQINWHDELDVLLAMGVKVYGVRAQNNSSAAPFYQEMSEHTGGAYITFSNFSIIADMFLAVCYKEASDEQFQAFCDEIDKQEEDLKQDEEGKDEASSSNAKKTAAAQDVKKVLKQIQEQAQQAPQDRPKRYVRQAWWDPKLDHGKPQYRYSSDTDSWYPILTRHAACTSSSSFTHPAVSHTPVYTPPVSNKRKSRFSLQRTRTVTTSDKKSCEIM